MKIAAFIAALLVAVATSSDLKQHALTVYKQQMEKSPCYPFFKEFQCESVNCTGFNSTKYTKQQFHETIEKVVKEIAEKTGAKVEEKKVLVCEHAMMIKMCNIEKRGMLNEDLSLNTAQMIEATNKIADEALKTKLAEAIIAVNDIVGEYKVKSIAQLAHLFRTFLEMCATDEQKALIAVYKEKVAQGKTPEEAGKEVLAELQKKNQEESEDAAQEGEEEGGDAEGEDAEEEGEESEGGEESEEGGDESEEGEEESYSEENTTAAGSQE